MSRVYKKLEKQIEKTCAQCSVLKPSGSFYKSSNGRLRSRCIDCYSAHNSQQREKHKVARAEYDQARGSGWERCDRDKYKLKDHETWGKHILRSYGLSVADYEQMLSTQNGVCAICNQLCNRFNSKRLCVDHDHKTGAIRGLLCFLCNAGLGKFRDDPNIVLKAHFYLNKTQQTA